MPEENVDARAVYEKMMQKDYCSQWMGIELVEITTGHCIIRMTVKKDMLNGFGILHGGIAFAFADSAFAFASNSHGRLAVSINGTMHYARSAKEGDRLLATARAINLTHRTADFDVNVSNEASGEVLYYFRGTVYRTSKLVMTMDT